MTPTEPTPTTRPLPRLRSRSRHAAPAAVAAVAMSLTVLALAGCGSEDGSGSTAAEPPGTAQGANGSTGQAAPDRAAAKPPAATPGETGAAQFETRGADNSIPRFGSEAGGSELEQAASSLTAYLRARAEENWRTACDALSAAASAGLKQLAASSERAPGGCPRILAALSSGVATDPEVRAGALRVQGDRGFLLYHGADGLAYFVPMVREDGSWKVAALAPSPLG